jgi:hypothetical protein
MCARSSRLSTAIAAADAADVGGVVGIASRNLIAAEVTCPSRQRAIRPGGDTR